MLTQGERREQELFEDDQLRIAFSKKPVCLV